MTHLPPLTFSIKKILRYLLLIFAIAGSFLFSPKPRSSSDYFGQYIHLGKAAGFTFNHDAAGFCMNSRYPGQLLRDSAIRQARPLYILAGTVVGYPLQWLVDWLDLPIFHSLGEEAAIYVGFYIGYIFINLVTIMICLLLFESIAKYMSNGNINPLLLLAFQVLLISNEITKAFFWTAHQQFLGLMTPLLTIYLCIKILTEGRSQKALASLSILTGVGMLVYGNFLPMFVCLVLASYTTDKKLHLGYFSRNAVLFILPTLIWVAVCVMKNGHYYNHEMAAYRQLVWMADALSISFPAFIKALADNTLSYFSTFNEILVFVTIACGLVVFSFVKRRLKEHRYIGLALIITGGVFFLFFLFLGFYQERLTYTLYPVLLCTILLCVIKYRWMLSSAIVLLVLAILWHLYTVCSYGPFS